MMSLFQCCATGRYPDHQMPELTSCLVGPTRSIQHHPQEGKPYLRNVSCLVRDRADVSPVPVLALPPDWFLVRDKNVGHTGRPLVAGRHRYQSPSGPGASAQPPRAKPSPATACPVCPSLCRPRFPLAPCTLTCLRLRPPPHLGAKMRSFPRRSTRT